MENQAWKVIEENLDIFPGLAELMTAAGNNLEEVELRRPELVDLIKSFLFNEQKRFCVKTVERQVTPSLTDLDEELPELGDLPVGSFFMNSTFRRTKLEVKSGKKRSANLMNIDLTIAKFSPYHLWFKALGDLITFVFNSTELAAANVGSIPEMIMKISKEMLPNLAENLSHFVKFDDIHMEIEHFAEADAFVHKISGDLNMEGIKEQFPAFELYLEHLNGLKLKICKPPTDEAVANDGEKRVKYCATADFGYEFILTTKGKQSSFEFIYASADGKPQMMWLNSETKLPNKDDFWSFSLDNHSEFLTTFDLKFKIPQLCGSFTAPTVIFKIEHFPLGDADGGFKISFVHIAKESMMTRMLVRPFMSLPTLHELLEGHFHVTLQLRQNGEFQDMHVNIAIPMLPPPKLCGACVSVFVKRALSKNGNLLLISHLLVAAGKDFKKLYETAVQRLENSNN